jgi:hypothetical protein
MQHPRASIKIISGQLLLLLLLLLLQWSYQQQQQQAHAATIQPHARSN